MVENFYENVLDFDIKIIKQCQMYGVFLPIEYRNDMQQINFRSQFEHSGNKIYNHSLFELSRLKLVKLPKSI